MNITPAQARTLAHGNPTQIRQPHRATHKPQRIITVRGKVDGKTTTMRAMVLTTRDAMAGELSFKDALAMGHKTTAQAKAAWVREHDRGWFARHKLYLLDREEWAELVDLELILTARFDESHAHRLIQVVTIQRVADEPRFLADQRRANAGQYTRAASRSIDPQAECIDEATQRRYTEKARIEGVAMRASFHAELEAERARRKAERGRSMRLPPHARRAA